MLQFRQFIYFLSLLVLLSVQAGKETAAASGSRYALSLPDRLFAQEASAEEFFEQHYPGNDISRVLIAHTKKKARFRAPDSVRSMERCADLQSTNHFRLVIAVNSHYYKANFSSQQYSFLFRLTPF